MRFPTPRLSEYILAFPCFVCHQLTAVFVQKASITTVPPRRDIDIKFTALLPFHI